MSVYGGFNGDYGYCVVVVFLKKVKRTIGRETGTRREANRIER